MSDSNFEHLIILKIVHKKHRNVRKMGHWPIFCWWHWCNAIPGSLLGPPPIFSMRLRPSAMPGAGPRKRSEVPGAHPNLSSACRVLRVLCPKCLQPLRADVQCQVVAFWRRNEPFQRKCSRYAKNGQDFEIHFETQICQLKDIPHHSVSV